MAATADGGGFGGFLAELGRRSRSTRHVAEDIGRRVGDELQERRRAEDARAELARLWRQVEALVEDRVAPAASRLSRSAGDYAEEGRDMALEAAEWVRSAARARPLLAVGVAIVATLAVTSLLGAWGRGRPRGD